jgi:hypothetical protein
LTSLVNDRLEDRQLMLACAERELNVFKVCDIVLKRGKDLVVAVGIGIDGVEWEVVDAGSRVRRGRNSHDLSNQEREERADSSEGEQWNQIKMVIRCPRWISNGC